MSDDRSASWECHAAGSDLGADGVSGEDAPAPLSRLESSAGGEMASLTEDEAALELEEGRSPVEEAGHEVEGAEDEDLGSTVEEGEEAALALDAPPTESHLSWFPEVGRSPGDPPEQVDGSWDIHCRSAQSDTCHRDNLARS